MNVKNIILKEGQGIEREFNKIDPKKIYMTFIEFQKELLEGRYKAPNDLMKNKNQIIKTVIYVNINKNNNKSYVSSSTFKQENDRIIQNFKKDLFYEISYIVNDERQAIIFFDRYSEEIYNELIKKGFDEKYLKGVDENVISHLDQQIIDQENLNIFENVFSDFVRSIKF